MFKGSGRLTQPIEQKKLFPYLLQVFTSAAASGILTNDLVSIMESMEQTGIEADTIDDNIFQWNVRVKNFAQNWLVSLQYLYHKMDNKPRRTILIIYHWND